MKTYRLALLGFGNVGKALARLFLDKRAELREKYGVEFIVTGIATGRHGVAINPKGLDVEAALVAQDLSALSQAALPQDENDFVRRCGADVLFESIPVNYQSGQPALDALRTSLENGMHVVTANKGPVIHGYEELSRLATAKGKKFFFEATVMDGAPIFSLFRGALPGANLKSFCGVLNSTTNMILSLMEYGNTFEQAVAHCQEIGIAETNPDGDIDGWDAAIKTALLVTVLMGYPLKPDQVDRTGIRQITLQEVLMAEQSCKRWKLICKAEWQGDGISASVKPELVTPDMPVYHVEGTSSYIQFETDVLGQLSIMETDPGPHTTAYGMFADFLNIVRG